MAEVFPNTFATGRWQKTLIRGEEGEGYESGRKRGMSSSFPEVLKLVVKVETKGKKSERLENRRSGDRCSERKGLPRGRGRDSIRLEKNAGLLNSGSGPQRANGNPSNRRDRGVSAYG